MERHHQHINTKRDQPVELGAVEIIAIAEQLDPAGRKRLPCRRNVVEVAFVHENFVGADQHQLTVVGDRAQITQHARIQHNWIKEVVAAEPVELRVRASRSAAAVALR